MDPSEQSELGYLPKRDDFEQEFLQNGEKIICNLTFLSNEDQTITGLCVGVGVVLYMDVFLCVVCFLSNSPQIGSCRHVQ